MRRPNISNSQSADAAKLYVLVGLFPSILLIVPCGVRETEGKYANLEEVNKASASRTFNRAIFKSVLFAIPFSISCCKTVSVKSSFHEKSASDIVSSVIAGTRYRLSTPDNSGRSYVLYMWQPLNPVDNNKPIIILFISMIHKFIYFLQFWVTYVPALIFLVKSGIR